MFHQIEPRNHGPLGAPMSAAVQACVHCGFCLAACPTYRELGQEMDSPRGRIVLMKGVLEGNLPLEAAAPHVDRCLGCLACEPACPSGVPYRDLISAFRAVTERQRQRPWQERVRRKLTSQTVPYPSRLRLALVGARLTRAVARFIPAALRPMLALAPARIPPRERWAERYPALGLPRGRVALLLGCAQSVLEPDINTATIAVLTRNGVEVVIPKGQVCCGALAWHVGNLAAAQEFARTNLAAFPEDVDAIVTNAAGCGSGMHDYHRILAGTAHEEAGERFRHRVMDVSAYLHRLGLAEPPRALKAPLRIAYQDACHLLNAQGVREQPRSLLRAIAGVEVVEIANPHLCCGSAGTYNLDQPEIAARLGAAKAEAILKTGASLVATGNIGCLTQLRHHLGGRVAISHTMQILRDAYAGTLGAKSC